MTENKAAILLAVCNYAARKRDDPIHPPWTQLRRDDEAWRAGYYTAMNEVAQHFNMERLAVERGSMTGLGSISDKDFPKIAEDAVTGVLDSPTKIESVKVELTTKSNTDPLDKLNLADIEAHLSLARRAGLDADDSNQGWNEAKINALRAVWQDARKMLLAIKEVLK